MRQNKIISIFILVGIIGSGCNKFAVQPSQTPNEIPPTTTLTYTPTATLTPTITPSPTATFTPSPTAIAGGSGNLLLSCTDTSEVKDLDRIFIYELSTDSFKPLNSDTPRPKSMPTNMSLRSERILAASPNGQVVVWEKCEFEDRYGYCHEYISDSKLSTNKRFVPDGNPQHIGHQFISNEILLFWTV